LGEISIGLFLFALPNKEKIREYAGFSLSRELRLVVTDDRGIIN